MTNEQAGEESTGLNPNYKGPLLKRWHTVEVVAKEGSELGLVEDSDHGVLTITVRNQGEPWPHGMEPNAGGCNTIIPGHRIYVVRADDHGPDISIWQRFAAYLRSCALSGEADPMHIEAFMVHPGPPAISSPSRSGGPSKSEP